jgi:hypothetical protein
MWTIPTITENVIDDLAATAITKPMSINLFIHAVTTITIVKMYSVDFIDKYRLSMFDDVITEDVSYDSEVEVVDERANGLK